MFKRLLTAIVVFPLSFIIVGLLTLILIKVGCSQIQGTQFNFSTLVSDPTVVTNAADTFCSNLQSCLHLSLRDMSMGQGCVMVFALAAAIIFFLSYLSKHLHVMLLPCRRYITMPPVFGCSFIIFGVLLNLAAGYIVDAIVQTSSAPDAKIKAVADFHAQDDGTVNLVVVIAAALIAFYLTIRLTRWDGLPWCRAPLPVRSPHRARQAL